MSVTGAGERPRGTRRQFLRAACLGAASTVVPAAQASGGDLVWEFDAGANVDLAGPTVVDDRVFVGSDDNTVHAVDTGTGAGQWQFGTGGSVNSAPNVVNGVVYVGSGHRQNPSDTSVYALDAGTGTQQWRFETGDAVYSSPTATDETVFVGSNDGNVYALDADTGDERWRFDTGDPIHWGSPTVVAGTVYIGGRGAVYALDADTGSKQWQFDTDDDSWNVSSPTVVDRTVYVGSNDGSVYALDADTGTEAWAYTTGSELVQSSPTVADGTVYIGSGENASDSPGLHAIDAGTGSQQWRFDTGGHVFSSPTVAGGRVFVGSGDANVYALDADTGDERWRFETGDGVWSSPVVSDGTVYVGSNDYSLYALDAGVAAASDGSRVRLGTRGHRGELADRVTTRPRVRFDVTVESVTEPPAGDDIEATLAVENTGYRSGRRTVSLTAADLESTTTELSLDGGESTTLTLSLSTGTGDAGTYTVTALAGDDSTQQETTVLEPAEFGLDIVETSTPVEGESLDVTVEVENTGDSAGTGTVALAVPGVGDDTVEVSLDGGDATTATLSVTTDPGEAGAYTATVDSGDGSDQREVTILERAAFAVEVTDVTDPVAGTGLELTAVVENTGDVPGTQTVELRVPDLGSDAATLSLEGGESTTVGLSVPTGPGDAGAYTATVESDEGSARRDVVVRDPAEFAVSINSVDGPAAGGPLELVVTVENTGDEVGTQAVELRADGLGSTTTSVSLDGGETTTETLALPTETGDTGEYTVTVEAGGDEATTGVVISTPGADDGTPDGGAGDETSDGDDGGDGSESDGVGTMELAAVGGGSGLALLLGAYVIMRRSQNYKERRTSARQQASPGQLAGGPTGTGESSPASQAEPGQSDDDTAGTDTESSSESSTATDATGDETTGAGAESSSESSTATDATGDETTGAGAESGPSGAGVAGSTGEEQSSDDEVDGLLDEVTAALDSARQCRDAGEYDRALASCERAADAADQARETARASAPDRVSDAESALDDVATLRGAIQTERDTRRETVDTLDRGETALDDAATALDGGSHADALDHLDDASTCLTDAETTLDDHEFPALAERAEQLRRRRDDLRERATARRDARGQVTETLDRVERTLDDAADALDSRDPGDAIDSLDDVPARLDDTGATIEEYGFWDLEERADRLDRRRENLRERAGTERDLRQRVTDALNRAETALDDAAAALDSGTPADALGHLDTAATTLDRASEHVADHDTPDLTDHISTLERRHEQLEQAARDTRSRVPTTVPDVPRLPLSYDDIEKSGELGRGGNADVYYAAAATESGTVPLALKEPRMSGGETLHTDTVEQMMGEAETWQRLDDHDHVVGVVDYGTAPLPWIAMEYMDGGHLGERVNEMGLEQKLWTALAVTEGVYHAHRRGVAHRDLKPANVLFRRVEDAWDVPKVADWGFSKRLLDNSSGKEGMSVPYAAPEQFSEDTQTDNVTDIYQLGTVCYELFTGRPPFEGAPFAVMRQIETEQPTPPSDLSAVPDGLDEVLLRALAKDRADRYEDIVYMRDDLAALRADDR